MRKHIILAVLCVGLGLALFASGVWASSVTLRVGSVQAAPGGAVDVPIQVQGASNIGAIQMVLVYDAAVLAPETVTRGPLAGSNALLDSNTQTPGRLGLGLVTLDGLQGDGTLATVRFKVLGSAGQSSPLTLEKVEAWEKTSYAPVLVATEPGQVTVGGAAIPTEALVLLAVCGCGGLLLVLALVLVAGLVMMRARRRPAASLAYGYPPAMPPTSQTYGYPQASVSHASPSSTPSYPGPAPTPGVPLTGSTQAYYTPAAGVPIAPVARLVVAQGQASIPYLDVSAGGVIIGRDPACGLVLYDPQASGQHARLDWAGHAWVIRDLNSRNGTYVNGVRVASQALRSGDQIVVGQTVLVFQG